jgi:hypothetical protein
MLSVNIGTIVKGQGYVALVKAIIFPEPSVAEIS